MLSPRSFLWSRIRSTVYSGTSSTSMGPGFESEREGYFQVIVFLERFDVCCVKGGEKVRCIGNIQGDCGGGRVNVNDNVWSIETRHEFGHAVFTSRFILSSPVKGAEHNPVSNIIHGACRSFLVSVK